MREGHAPPSGALKEQWVGKVKFHEDPTGDVFKVVDSVLERLKSA